MHVFSGRGTMLRDDRPDRASARHAEAEAIALAYRAAHHGNDRVALVAAISDALADLDAAEQRMQAAQRNVSRGYARGKVGAP